MPWRTQTVKENNVQNSLPSPISQMPTPLRRQLQDRLNGSTAMIWTTARRTVQSVLRNAEIAYLCRAAMTISSASDPCFLATSAHDKSRGKDTPRALP